jgi:hypothetical protein
MQVAIVRHSLLQRI